MTPQELDANIKGFALECVSTSGQVHWDELMEFICNSLDEKLYPSCDESFSKTFEGFVDSYLKTIPNVLGFKINGTNQKIVSINFLKREVTTKKETK